MSKFTNFIEKGKKGYCKEDLWSIDIWFLKTIVPMLKEFKENLHGYPSNYTNSEEWDKELDNLIFYFSEANEETCSEKNEVDYESDSDGWLHREREIYNYRNEMKNKAFELFKNCFWDLWD